MPSTSSASDIVTLADSYAVLPKKSLTDVVTIAESIGFGFFETVTDVVSLSDSVSSELKEFLSDMQADFETILSDVPFSETVTWSRASKTEDEMGRISGSSSWTKEINVIIQPITEKDKDVLPAGIRVTGYVKAYVRWQYKVSDAVGWVSVRTGDTFIRDDGNEYMVEKIIGKYGGAKTEVFRKLILREIDNG